MHLFNVVKDYSSEVAVNLADYLTCILDHDFDLTYMAAIQWLHSNGYSFRMVDLSEYKFQPANPSTSYEDAQDQYDYLDDEDFVTSVW